MGFILDKYKEYWEPLILPDDYKYSEAELGEKIIVTKSGSKVIREDF